MERYYDNAPAIVRDFGEKDAAAKVISTPYEATNQTRGLGQTGYKVQVVEHECPNCHFDRMVRRIDYNPEMGNSVNYHCLYPNCGHFLGDQMTHAFNAFQKDEPTEFEGVEQ